MYLPRSLLSKLYIHLQKSHHPLSPPVLILVALEPDALCGCRILTHLLKRDYIPHKIQPIAGYGDLERAGRDVIQPMMESRGGSGGVVICLGVGGMVDLGSLMGLETEDDASSYGGVEVWIVDARRPWNLANVFGGSPPIVPQEGEEAPRQSLIGIDGGKIQPHYKPGRGGIVVFDDGDIEEEMENEKSAYLALLDMPEVPDDGEDSDGSDTDEDEDEHSESGYEKVQAGQKRKSWSDQLEEDESEDEDRPRQRRRSNMVCLSPRKLTTLQLCSDHFSSRVQFRVLPHVLDGVNSCLLTVMLQHSPPPVQYHRPRLSHQKLLQRRNCGDAC